MAAFPSFASIPFLAPVEEGLRFKTLVSKFDELGTEQTKQKWLYPRRDFLLKYVGLSQANARTLWQFYIARGGRYSAFNFFWPVSDTYTTEYVGVGDGTTTVFNCPSKGASSYTVYVEGVAKEITTDYTFSSEGGTDGADEITFVAAPTDGDKITFSFTGYLKTRCRFADDMQSFEAFRAAFTNMGVRLKGVLNE